MSLWELVVVGIVALLVTEPEDIPSIFKYVKQCSDYFNKTKKEVFSYFEREFGLKESEIDLDKINFYLEKIISIEGKYEGEYSIDAIKTRYNDLMRAKISEEKRL